MRRGWSGAARVAAGLHGQDQARGAGAGPLRSQRRGGHRLQRDACLAAEYPAGLGQRDRAAGPLEQGHAQPAFQLPDRLGQCGLRDAQPGRGAAKVKFGHVAIGTWIAGTPDALEGAPLKEPDDIARLYWDLHTGREPPNTSSPPDPAVHVAPMTVPTASGEKDADKDYRLNRNRQGAARRRGHLAEIRFRLVSWR